MLTLVSLSVLVWLVLLVGRGGFWLADQRLPAAHDPLTDWPEVVTIIPARDESQSIGAVLASHAASKYQGQFSVILVDDGSTDGTPEIAQGITADSPRPIGSQRLEEVREYIFDQLTEYGLEPRLDETTVFDAQAWPQTTGATVGNIVARIVGSDSTGSILLIYLAVSLAVLRLRQRDGMPEEGEYTVPFGPVIPILSCLFVVGLLLQIPLDEATAIAALIGTCVVIYVIRSLLRKRRKQ